VLKETIESLQSYFSIDRWQISQPIEIGSVELEISKVNGVRSISSFLIKNLTIKDGDYSENEYDIDGATINKTLYPSMDPSIFELKYPNKDIIGRVV
jgi:hypothetical protein